MQVSKCQLKKNSKKIEKIKLRLIKYGFVFSDEPTVIIIIANAGLRNDVKRQELEFHLSPFDEHIKDIITTPQLTFAVVLCKNCSSSSEIFTKLQSFTILTPDLNLRPSVNAFCLYSQNLPPSIGTEIAFFDSEGPPGLILIEDLIGVEEENSLVETFKNLGHVNTNKDLKHRTVLHFGYEFNYTNNRVDASTPLIDNPIPKSCSDLLLKLEKRTNKNIYSTFDQLTVNIYQSGDGIPPHTDTHSAFTDEIVSISLNSDITMQWTHPINHEVRNVDLKARSACIMTEEARYLWKHSIAARKSDLIFHSENRFEKRQRSLRISLTFRKLAPVTNGGQCHCKYPISCDTPQRNDEDSSNTCPPDLPANIEALYVHKVYDIIADHFSSTRHSMWPRVRAFIDRQSMGSIGADIGCGNGKYFPAMLARGLVLATDSSGNLCRIAASQHPQAGVDTVQSNCLQLPYRNGCCDYFICIAVVHHLSTSDRRQTAIDRMVRMLRRHGQGLVYVWAQDQRQGGERSKYLDKSPAVVVPTGDDDETVLPVHVNRTEFRQADMLVPWKCPPGTPGANSSTGTVTTSEHRRYYHLFQQGELEDLCTAVDGVRVAESWYDNGNWAVVIEKL